MSDTEARPPERNPAWHIAVVSFTVLVLELALIRQVPAEVRVVSYFTNLLLFASFFGLGLGAILQSWRDLGWTFPAGLAMVAGFVAFAHGLVIYDEANVVHFWLQYSSSEKRAINMPILPAIAAAFVSGATVFVGLGQKLARTMDEHPRLRAYGWDIAGSLAGTVTFALAAAAGVPPWVWPLVLAPAWAFIFPAPAWQRAAVIVAGALFLTFTFQGEGTRWSPYYLLQASERPEGLEVNVNSSFHQLALDFRSKKPELAGMQQTMMDKFSTPYREYGKRNGRAPRSVLILGAGTGNDVYVALQNGAGRVVAVEIDPVILELGKRNPSRPYDDPRVQPVTDDGRHYVRTTTEKFDLVIFGTLDSQTLLSGQANLRLDNFVYTRESFRDARAVLAPDGVIGVYYSVFRPWLYGRLLRTAVEGFGSGCGLTRFENPFLFNTAILCVNAGTAVPTAPQLVDAANAAIPATDDWPFVYLEKRTIAPLYLQAFALLAILIGATFLIVRKLHPGEPAHAEFFLLGLGFTLVESAAIVRLALLFGSTWVVNAVVFASVLAMIFVANAAVLRRRAPSLPIAWTGLVLALAVNAVLPLDALLALPSIGRVAVAALLVGTPVFFAAVCFSRLFAQESSTGFALGVNLVGAMAGGGLEYLSMVLGMRAVWWIAVCVYLAAVLMSRRRALMSGVTPLPSSAAR